MSCCGNKRAAISKTPLRPPPLAKLQTPNAVVWFQYTGVSVLTVIGKATNMPYRFFYSGATQAVDMRDYETLAAVPNLQQTAAPQK
jgi:hypothetical protein